jgi:hypothetical protein
MALNTRRSQRVVAHIPVKILGREGVDSAISEATHTLIVSAHGALVVLAANVRLGVELNLQHALSKEEALVRVVRVIEERDNPTKVAVEFIRPAPNFWHIDFPPSDWEAPQAESTQQTP